MYTDGEERPKLETPCAVHAVSSYQSAHGWGERERGRGNEKAFLSVTIADCWFQLALQIIRVSVIQQWRWPENVSYMTVYSFVLKES